MCCSSMERSHAGLEEQKNHLQSVLVYEEGVHSPEHKCVLGTCNCTSLIYMKD